MFLKIMIDQRITLSREKERKVDFEIIVRVCRHWAVARQADSTRNQVTCVHEVNLIEIHIWTK